jgi:hypothetical protein
MIQQNFQNENSLLEFLHQHGFKAIPSKDAESFYLHAWKREGLDQLISVALWEGLFFLAVLENGLGLYVSNDRDLWYYLVWFWDKNVSEDVFVKGLKELVHSRDIHSSNSYVWACVRKTAFEFEWQRNVFDIEPQNVSLELKEIVFEFGESLIENPNLSNCKQAILDLLILFTNDEFRNSSNLQVVQKYFPPLKYERWNLPDVYKRILDEIGYYFETNSIPKTATVKNLIRKTESLKC